MAITSVKKNWQGRGGTTDEKGVRTLTRAWIVTTDSDADGEPQVIDGVIATDASAALYASHPNWALALCRKLSAAPHGGPRVWMVTAEYSSAAFAGERGAGVPGDGSGTPGNPSSPSSSNSNSTPADQRAPTINATRKEVTKVLEKDAVTGNRVVNTVGDPFDPPPEVFRSHHIITAKFFRTPLQLDWENRSEWMDSINSEPVTILGKVYPDYTLRCTAYDVGTVWETGAAGMSFFYELTVQVEYDPDGWWPKILNTGRRRVTGSLGDTANPRRKVAIVDEHGQPVADPVPLDASGTPLGPDPVEADYHYVEPNGYVPYDWNGTGGTWTGAGGILG